MAYNPLNPNGQAAMANSQPVVIASNQSPVSVAGTIGASVLGVVPVGDGTLNISVGNGFPGGDSAAVGNGLRVAPYNLVYNGSNWDRQRGNSSIGTLVSTGPSSVIVIIQGSVATTGVPAANQSVSGTVNVASLISMPGIVSNANSSSVLVTSTLSFTGTGEEWKDFGSIVINVFTDATSATDGLSIQQSSDNTNWDIRDTYTVPSMAAGAGKTFQVQPAARFGRIVYTQGAQNSGAFRLQTVYHPQMVKPSSQRPQDGYTNETDLEQNQTFNMFYNGSTWDRVRGNTTDGLLIKGSVQGVFSVLGTLPVTQSGNWNVGIVGSVATFQGGTQITSLSGTIPVAFVAASIAGTYAEDAGHTNIDRGLFVLAVRNDTVSSFTSANTDYNPIGTDSAGRVLTKPFAAGEASLIASGSLVSAGTIGSVQVFAAPGAGLKNYITDFNFSNTSATTTLVIIGDRDASVLSKTIAPAGGGSNHSYQTPITGSTTNVATGVQIVTSASVVHFVVSGFKAP